MIVQEQRLQADAAKQGIALKMAQLEAEAHTLKEGMAICLLARQQGLASQQQDLRTELAALQVRGRTQQRRESVAALHMSHCLEARPQG